MKKTTILLLVCISFIFSANVNAQLTAQQAILEMSRGINLGNTLDAPYEGDWAPAAQEYYFDDYQAAGVKTVRVPVTWDKHTSWDAPYYPVDGAWMDRVEQVVDWGLNRGMYVIINMHHEDWFFCDYYGGEQRFYSIWYQIIQRFKNKSQKLVFEIINEPITHGGCKLEQWQVDAVNQGVLDMIRAENPTRLVVYGGANWSNSQDLFNAAVPGNNDQYLIGYYHSYDPFDFSHECNEYTLSQEGRQYLWDKFWSVNDWSNNTGVPVLLGEFGCRKCVDYDNMLEHYTINVTEALRYGFAYCAWDDGGWFEIHKRQPGQWHEDIKNILFQGGGSGCDNATAVAINGTTRIEAENYCEMNDVQTETCYDIGGGINVGWINNGSWLAYKIDVPTSGTYQVSYRVASAIGGGQLQLEPQGGGSSYGTLNIGDYGEWQDWVTLTHNVQLSAGVQTIAIAAVTGGWNINWFEISGSSNYSLTTYTSGSGTISLNPGGGSYPAGTNVTATANAAAGWRFVNWTGDASGSSASTAITMNGNKSITAVFEEDVTPFSITIQAEDYSVAEAGIQTETCYDVDGGLNVGWTEPGRWMAYNGMVDIPSAGTYTVEYRVASTRTDAVLRLEQNAGATNLGEVTIDVNNGWQGWDTRSHTVYLNAGVQDFGIACVTGGWNINWFRISSGGAKAGKVALTNTTVEEAEIALFPNPATNQVNISSSTEISKVSVFEISGKLIKNIDNINNNNLQLNIDDYNSGLLLVRIETANHVVTKKLYKK